MAVNFTPVQEQAIGLRGCNILVSAAAGSGKTAVLTERIVRLVTDEEHPVDIDRLLVVTFSNAAAAEMRERIALKIADKLKDCPESEHIQRQATLIHNAPITTIDSFCLSIVRNHFHEIGLDPAFRVADPNEILLLQQDVCAELLEDLYAAGNEDFLQLVEFFCPGGREDALEEVIMDLARQADNFPFPEEWLLSRKLDYRARTMEEFAMSDAGVFLKQYIDKLLDGSISRLGEAVRIIQEPDGPYMYGEMIEAELEALQSIRGADSLAEYALRLPNVKYATLSSKRDASVSAEKRELVKAMRTQVKNLFNSISKECFSRSPEGFLAQSEGCERALVTLVDVTMEFMNRLMACKREKKVLSFLDMEHYALNILLTKDGEERKPSRVAQEYKQYYHEVYIDEYQDSNPLQELLLRTVSGEDEGHFNRFMVGDVKQSIYRFRQARPEIFEEKYLDYAEEGTEKRRIDLNQNFRSRTTVVNTINSVFERIMTEETGRLIYDEHAALKAGAVYPENEGCESELLLVEKPDKDAEDSEREAEARAVAGRIRELMEKHRVSNPDGSLRRIRYADIVILLRTNKGWDEVFKRILEEEGIPAYIASKTGYYAASEVVDLLQLCRVLDNPRQDIPLFGMLKSVFGGFTEEEIALLRAGHKGMTLYEALVACEVEDAALRQRVQSFLDMLDRYRGYTVYMPIRELLECIVEEHDYLNYVTALPAGNKRRANVEMLFTKASDFEKTSYFGLFHFIRYMEQLEADLLDENADVVRIMSVHKSKGLEFPVTFVSGFSKKFNTMDSSKQVVTDMDLGIGMVYVDAQRRVKSKTLRQKVLSYKSRLDNLNEELRILYVAMTRAKEKLILTATMSDAAKAVELACRHSEEALSFCDFIKAGSYLDFLMPVLDGTLFDIRVMEEQEMRVEACKNQLMLSEKKERLLQAAFEIEEERVERLKSDLCFTYPFAALSGLYTKTTVSELKIAAMAERAEEAFHAFEEKEPVPCIPSFRKEEEAVSGTVRGNAYHRAMELMNFDGIYESVFAELPSDYEVFVEGVKEADLTPAISRFLEGERDALRLDEEYRKALNVRKLEAFLKSEWAYRMWAADRRGELYREQPFVLGVSASRLSPDYPEEERVLVQGIIDVFWVENGEIVLLDYKTDVVKALSELWNRYETQMDYYREALENIRGLSVKERILYSFHLQKGKD